MRLSHHHELDDLLAGRPDLLDVEVQALPRYDDAAFVERALALGYRQIHRVEHTERGNYAWGEVHPRTIRFTLVPDAGTGIVPASPGYIGASTTRTEFEAVLAEVRSALAEGRVGEQIVHAGELLRAGMFRSAEPPADCPAGHAQCRLQSQQREGKFIRPYYSRPALLLWEYLVHGAAGTPVPAPIHVDMAGHLVADKSFASQTAWHSADRELHEFVASGRRQLGDVGEQLIVNTSPTLSDSVPEQIRKNAWGKESDRLSHYA